MVASTSNEAIGSGERTFRYRAHLRSLIHGFICLTASGVLASGVFVYAIDPDPRAGLISLLVSAAVAGIAAGLTFHASNLWTAQVFTVGDSGVEHRLGRNALLIPYSDIVAVTFAATPFVSGRASIEGVDRRIIVPTAVADAHGLIDAVLEKTGRADPDELVDVDDYRAWRETALFCEQRGERMQSLYQWFPWLALASPFLVAMLNLVVRVSFGHFLLWTTVFAIYPWLIAIGYELVLAMRFRATTLAGPSPILPKRDPGFEERVARRTVLVAYFGFLALNLLVFVRVA